jgi:hypothetical protein
MMLALDKPIPKRTLRDWLAAYKEEIARELALVKPQLPTSVIVADTHAKMTEILATAFKFTSEAYLEKLTNRSQVAQTSLRDLGVLFGITADKFGQIMKLSPDEMAIYAHFSDFCHRFGYDVKEMMSEYERSLTDLWKEKQAESAARTIVRDGENGQ